MEEFFRNVFGTGEGRAVIVLPNASGKPVNDTWFAWPAQAADMAAFALANQNTDVWYSPVLFKTDSRTKDQALTLSVAAADADECSPDNFRERPSMAVETSVGHWHVYWKLDQPYDAHAMAALNRRIAQVHKGDGCDTAFVNAAKLLRVPGTSNNKHPGAVVIVADRDDDLVYTKAGLDDTYPVSEVPDALEVEKSAMPDDMAEWAAANRSTLLAGLPNSLTLRDVLFNSFREDKRSDARFKLLCELFRLGLDTKGVVAVAWGAPSNKYRDDPRGFRGLWDEAVRAGAAIQAEQDKYDRPAGEFFDEEGGELPIPPAPEVRTSFLTPEEQEKIKDTINFIDQWINWTTTKTDAPSEYARAAAITIMSAVYSEYGHALPIFAPKGLKLNVWMMVLGRSTLDRKSTQRGFMNDAFRALKDDDHNYSIGDDVTPSGISLALHDRANKATVFDRDEVQGLFKELLHQSYMSGGLEVFTKLYDGWSGGRVRSTGDKKVMESVPVSFIMFLMGILSETADVLTITNYRSGFLTRFLYVIGRRPEGYKPPPIQQGKGGEDGGETVDKVFNGLVEHLAIRRNFWEMRAPEAGKTYAVRADEDAWARLQQFEQDVAARVEESVYAEVIASTSSRMVISVLKTATLLAMDDESLTVTLQHMLQAIEYAGEWYDNAVVVASMVSESEWQRDVDKLEAFISGKGGKCSYAIAYQQFQSKRTFEFDEMVSALEARGVLKRVQHGNKWVLEMTDEE